MANYALKIARPAVLLLAALVGLLGETEIDLHLRQLIVLAAVLSFLPYLLLRVVVHRGAVGAVMRIAGKLPLLRRASAGLLSRSLARDVDGEVRQFWRQHRADWMLVLLFQCVGRIAGCLTVYIALHALGLDYSLSRAALIYAAISVADSWSACRPPGSASPREPPSWCSSCWPWTRRRAQSCTSCCA